MNSLIRKIKKRGNQSLVIRPIPLDNLAVVGASDAAFDNVPEHRSQGGHVLGVIARDAVHDHEQLYRFVPLEWKSGKVKRVVRSTLAAEGYAMGACAEGTEWLRTLLAELSDVTAKKGSELEAKSRMTPAVLVTDARSLYDVLVAEKVNISDRRLSLEAALIRQVAKWNTHIKWVRSEQMIADCLTKVGVDPSYAETVFDTGLWSFGPDIRAPVSVRKRALIEPG